MKIYMFKIMSYQASETKAIGHARKGVPGHSTHSVEWLKSKTDITKWE